MSDAPRTHTRMSDLTVRLSGELAELMSDESWSPPGVWRYLPDRELMEGRTLSRSDVLEWLGEHGEAEQVQWCEEHYSVTWDDWQTENYLYCQRNREGYLGRCSIIPKLLVDVEEEA